ncbi:hypothetical protein D3C75_1155560 [compost metagenome]
MLQEAVGRGVGDGAPRRPPTSAQPHEIHLQQQVQRPLGQGNPTHALDLGAGAGLVIGDDGQGLQRGLGQATRLLALLSHQEAQVGGGAETPAIRHTFQLDPASLIALA